MMLDLNCMGSGGLPQPVTYLGGAGADPGFLKGGGGSILGLQAKKRGGGPRCDLLCVVAVVYPP